MKKLLIVLALLVSGSVRAEWVKVSDADNRMLYIDPASIRKDGDLRVVWEVIDLKRRHKDGQMSHRSKVEYDCKAGLYRFLLTSSHSGPMADGVTIFSAGVDPTGWKTIASDSSRAVALGVVCSN